MAEIGLFDAIYSARSLRRFKPDPVPDDVITKVLDAAIRAPSGSNQQSWEFVVIKDAAQRKKIGAVYQKGGAILKALYTDRVKPEHMAEDTYNKLMASAYYLIDHMADAPVLLIACLKQVPMTGAPPKLPPEVAAAMKSQARISGSSIYPAVQNIILACRGLGLGTVLTTHSHVLRGRGEGDTGPAARSDHVCADADWLSAGKVRPDQAPPGERGRIPGPLRQSLEGLSAARYQSGSFFRSSVTLPARWRTWSCCESSVASTAGSDLPLSRYSSAACANFS